MKYCRQVMRRWWISFWAVALLVGCHAAGDEAEDAVRFQREYVALLKNAPASPVPAEDRARYAWDSLFYPYNDSFRWVGRAIPYRHRRMYVYAYGEGWSDSLPLWGTLLLPYGGDTFRLQLFLVNQDGDSSLFLPFYDLTNGTETYGGGRYLELPYGEGRTVVDFNYATHPYCAYNTAYSCMLPPEQNRIPVAVRAGERLVAAMQGTQHSER